MAHHHLTDAAAYLLASLGVATTIAPPDYGALGVAAIGGVIGGFLSVAIVPAEKGETRRTVGLKWGVSSLTSISLTPFLFQRLTAHANAAGELPTLTNTAEAMLALSTVVGFGAWVALQLAQVAWHKWAARKLDVSKPE